MDILKEANMEYERLQEQRDCALKELGRHLAIREDLIEINEAPLCTAGHYGDVYRATLHEPDRVSSRIVAVKELRTPGAEATRVRLTIRLARELRVWAKLKHPNILELIGYHLNEQMTTARFVSPFMANGNIDEYLKATPSPVSDSLRLKLLRDSLNGLVYLHSLDGPICHADIKPENVLITDSIEAVLCDFGLARLADGQPSGLTTTKRIKGSLRYMSPELVEEDAVHTLSSDIWAYGCLVLKVITGASPYESALSEFQLLSAMYQKLPPADLDTLDNSLKPLLTKCWDGDPSARPSASECLQYLPQPGTNNLQPPDNRVDTLSSALNHSPGDDMHDSSFTGVANHKSASDIQVNAESATEGALISSKISKTVSPDFTTSSRHGEPNLLEVPPQSTPSNDNAPDRLGRSAAEIQSHGAEQGGAILPNTQHSASKQLRSPQDRSVSPDPSVGPNSSRTRAASQIPKDTDGLLSAAAPRSSQSAIPPATTPTIVPRRESSPGNATWSASLRTATWSVLSFILGVLCAGGGGGEGRRGGDVGGYSNSPRSNYGSIQAPSVDDDSDSTGRARSVDSYSRSVDSDSD